MANYTKRECKRFIRDRCYPHDCPLWVKKEVSRIKREMDRQIPSMREEMDNYMREMKARRWIPVDSKLGKFVIGLKRYLAKPGWLTKFKIKLQDLLS